MCLDPTHECATVSINLTNTHIAKMINNGFESDGCDRMANDSRSTNHELQNNTTKRPPIGRQKSITREISKKLRSASLASTGSRLYLKDAFARDENKDGGSISRMSKSLGRASLASADSSLRKSSLITLSLSEEEEMGDDDVFDDATDQSIADAPDGGWGWAIVLGSFISQTIGSGLERSKGILYLELLEKYNKSSVATSWVLTLSSSVGFLAGPFVSSLCDRLSCRTVAFIGALMVSVGTMVSSIAPNLAMLYITFGVVTGIGRILIYTPCLVIVGQYFQNRLGLAVGLSSAGNGAGSFIFPTAMELLFSEYDFFWAMLLLSAISMHFFVAAAIYRPLIQPKRETVPKEVSTTTSQNVKITNKIIQDGEKRDYSKPKLVKFRTLTDTKASKVLENNNADSLEDDRNNFINFKKKCPKQLRLLKNYLFTATCIQVLFHHMAKQVAYLFLPAFAVSRGIGIVEAAVLLSTIGVCESVSKLIMTIVLDLQHLRKYRLFIYSFVVMAMGIVLAAVPSMDSFKQLMTASAIYGVLCGTRSQKNIVIVDTLGSEYLTASMGWLLLFQGIGSILGPTLAAVLKDNLGNYDVALYLGAAGHFIGGLFMITGNIWMLRKQSSEKDISV